MQTRPLPETPGARSPAGAEIRYLMGQPGMRAISCLRGNRGRVHGYLVS